MPVRWPISLSCCLFSSSWPLPWTSIRASLVCSPPSLPRISRRRTWRSRSVTCCSYWSMVRARSWPASRGSRSWSTSASSRRRPRSSFWTPTIWRRCPRRRTRRSNSPTAASGRMRSARAWSRCKRPATPTTRRTSWCRTSSRARSTRCATRCRCASSDRNSPIWTRRNAK